jgi:Gamma tubulin complex component N-terminal/Gamma tubulin complex component C-terminal
MLHEALLALSGHPSPLFDPDPRKVKEDFPDLSPSEIELFQRIGRISKLHRDLRTKVRQIQAKHPSPICKAVATSISTSQLSAFQQQILAFEKKILQRDSEVVGAYSIVPLATIYSEFESWTRLLEWLTQLGTFMIPSHTFESGATCRGADLINKLRIDAQTGFPDIEEAAIKLSKVAELAWLRQLSNWLLHGQLPLHAESDFFIKPLLAETSRPASQIEFRIDSTVLPKFVTEDCATSILFVGKSLNQIRSRTVEFGQRKQSDIKSGSDLIPQHRNILSQLVLPISNSSLSEAVSSIRSSLSQEILQKLLPLEQVIGILKLFHEIVLLDHGEFAISLIREADERLEARNRQGAAQLSGKDLTSGPPLKAAELTSILRKTWAYLFSISGENDEFNETLELARDIVSLSTYSKPSHQSRKPLPFDDFLLPVSSSLIVTINNPLDLFLTPRDILTYSSLNSYLLSLRRGHYHLTNLWKQSVLRRDHPTPLGPPRSCTPYGQKECLRMRKRQLERRVRMRKVWATCSAAMYLLHELCEYFQGQVVPSLFQQLMSWITKPPSSSSRPGTSDSSRSPLRLRPVSRSNQSKMEMSISRLSVAEEETSQHDPASLSAAHTSFLTSLSAALLYTDSQFTSSLHALLKSVDLLVANILRLQNIEHNLDLEEDSGVVDALADNLGDHGKCLIELDRARKKVDSAMKLVVSKLKSLGESEQTSGNILIDTGPATEFRATLQGVTLESLLMKLEFGRGDDALHDSD